MQIYLKSSTMQVLWFVEIMHVNLQNPVQAALMIVENVQFLLLVQVLVVEEAVEAEVAGEVALQLQEILLQIILNWQKKLYQSL